MKAREAIRWIERRGGRDARERLTICDWGCG